MEVNDTTRIDFLEEHPEFHLEVRARGKGQHKSVRWACYLGLCEHNLYPTLREAIDAAMRGEWND
jgi:hypothetical protein